MPRALWKGSIAFGLVTIPVELHTAVRDSRPRFRLLHAGDRSPVHYERVCEREGTPVAWDDLVKGYEYEKGRFVVLTKEDFRTAALEKTRTVDILSFVRGTEIDDRFFETPYYLLPGKGAERAYALLREALRESGRIGIATIVLRDAQHLAALEVIDQALVLTLMRFAEELADASGYAFPAADVRKPELEMARTLIENLADTWKPEQYTDRYRENLMRIIQARIKGRKPDLQAPPEPEQAEVVDLMERLRRSLQRAGAPRAGAAHGRAAKPARSRVRKRKTAGRRRKSSAA